MTAFRDAGEDDLPDIVRLLADDVLGQAREEAGDILPPCYAAAFRAMLAQGGRVILAIEDGAIVGCLQFNVIHGLSHTGRSRAQIESVRVRSDLRGSGAGTRLMHFAIAEATRAGCGLVQLTSQATRTDAIRFYVKLGFVQSHAGMKLALAGG